MVWHLTPVVAIIAFYHLLRQGQGNLTGINGEGSI